MNDIIKSFMQTVQLVQAWKNGRYNADDNSNTYIYIYLYSIYLHLVFNHDKLFNYTYYQINIITTYLIKDISIVF
jgi:hypothetical protein